MFRNILVPIDLEEPHFSDRAIRLAIKGARDSGAELHLLTVIPGSSTPLVSSYFHQAAIKKASGKAAMDLKHFVASSIPGSIPVHLHVLDGLPAEQILKCARDIDADLVIMAAHNREYMDAEAMGSTSSRVVEKARCSVVVLRADADRERFEFQLSDQPISAAVF